MSDSNSTNSRNIIGKREHVSGAASEIAPNTEFIEKDKACKNLIDELNIKRDSFKEDRWLGLFENYIDTHKRILYSSISWKIYEIDNPKNKLQVSQDNEENILENLKKAMSFEYNCSIIDKELLEKIINKLYDHINLAIKQSNTIKDHICEIQETLQKDSEEKLSTVSTELTSKSDKKLQKLKDELLENSKSELKNSEKNYITILGILATIIITITSGISFSAAVLENINKASIYRIIITCTLLGIVQLNTLYFLYRFIDNIVRGKNIKEAPPVFIAVNVLLVLLLFTTHIAWWLGVIERRNITLENRIKNEQTVTSPSPPQLSSTHK